MFVEIPFETVRNSKRLAMLGIVARRQYSNNTLSSYAYHLGLDKHDVADYEMQQKSFLIDYNVERKLEVLIIGTALDNLNEYREIKIIQHIWTLLITRVTGWQN